MGCRAPTQIGGEHPGRAQVHPRARPDGAPIYIILDNLSAHRGEKIRSWAATHKVELCFTPTYASWANPIEAHFGPLRTIVVAGSNHPNHAVATRALHGYLRWRNANARHPDLLAHNAENAPASAANTTDNGAKAEPNPPDQPREPKWSQH